MFQINNLLIEALQCTAQPQLSVIDINTSKSYAL